MQRYEMDEYVQEHADDDSVSANCVASWRANMDAEGQVLSLLVDHHNSWYFDSRKWNGSPDVPGRLLRELQRSERGRVGSRRVTSCPIAV
jgi:hypothetical protein